MIKVLLVDDHHIFREGLARILEDAPGIDFIGSAADGESALALVDQKPPDVVLMDINMPGIGGLEATQCIMASHPSTKILILTISEQGDDLFEAIRLGARGYLLKNSSTQALLEAIRLLHAGEAPITPMMAAKLVEEFASLSSDSSQVDDIDNRIEELTTREKDVLNLVARGMSNKEIGSSLSISPLTVKAHLSSILEKLHLRGRVEATAWAIRHGVLREE